MCAWTSIRFAIWFLCRISEWAFKDQYSVKWKHVNFYTKEGRLLHITQLSNITRAYEMEVIFYSEIRGHFGPEHAEARNPFYDRKRRWPKVPKGAWLETWHDFGY